MSEPTPTATDLARDTPADASTELAYYANKYRDVPIRGQFDLLMIYVTALAAETQSTSLINSEIQWLRRSVESHLAALAARGLTIAGPGQLSLSRPALDQCLQAITMAQAVLDQLTGPDGDRTIRRHIDAAEAELRAALSGTDDQPAERATEGEDATQD